MAFNRDKGQEFDEFFGTGRRQAPARESYSPRDDFTRSERQRPPQGGRPMSPGRGYFPPEQRSGRPMAQEQQGGRAQAVRERFGSQHGQPEPRRAAGQREAQPYGRPEYSERPSGRNNSRSYAPLPEDDGWFEPPERPKVNAKMILLTVLGVIAGILCAGAAVFFLRPTDGGAFFAVNRSLPMVSNLRQTSATGSSVRLDWDPVEAVAGYRIYRAEQSGEPVLIKTVPLSQATITGLAQGTWAEYIISPYCTDGTGEYTEQDDARSIIAKTTMCAAGPLEHLESTQGSITLEWAPAQGADGYIIEQKTGSWFRYEQCGDAHEAKITIPVAEASTEYTFRMRPYIDLGEERQYGRWSDKFTAASSPRPVHDLVQGQTTDSGYVLNWEVDSAVTGFELYRADADTGEITELLSQCGNNYYEISGLESVNVCSYRVRGFLRHSGGISYGEFSPVVTAVTLPSKVQKVDQYTAADGAYTLSWQPAERAAGYELYAYSCHRNEYYLLATVTEPEYTIAGLSEYAERYKVRAYATLGELQFFGDYSDELPCYPYYYLKRTVRVDVESTSMHSYSGPEYDRLGELKRDTKCRVIGERSGSDGSRWFRVELTDGTIGWISREDVVITNKCGTLATREYTDEAPIVIYLSPSRQDNNFFWNQQTTEKEQMEAVGAVTHRILEEEYNCIVYTATPELELRERAFEALELGADVYLAIHSNATGTADVHYGASSYYCNASGRSKNLGQTIVDRLNAIAPKNCTLHKQMYPALDSFGGVGYAEVRDPYNLGMVTVLAETDFHDNELTGQWIINSHEAIGRAYAEALAITFDIKQK